jgi:hypothetical protein
MLAGGAVARCRRGAGCRDAEGSALFPCHVSSQIPVVELAVGTALALLALAASRTVALKDEVGVQARCSLRCWVLPADTAAPAVLSK